ncbi:type VI secretion system contractile sheath large subunit, partial [Escherichia coli]|nr:type VI secretion system contractile sheath large subunit [Escherichia coli]
AFHTSQLFKKVYASELGSAGGDPYGALSGAYEFTSHPEDIESLRLMSNVAASGFSPFLSAASPALFGFDEWTELSKPRDLD